MIARCYYRDCFVDVQFDSRTNIENLILIELRRIFHHLDKLLFLDAFGQVLSNSEVVISKRIKFKSQDIEEIWAIEETILNSEFFCSRFFVAAMNVLQPGNR